MLIIDLMLPDVEGVDICYDLRSKKGVTTPILVLTALDGIEHKVPAFNNGADD